MKYLIFAIIPWLFVSCFSSEPPCCLEWTEEEYTIENTDEESVEVEQYEHGEHFSVEIKNFFVGRNGFSDILFPDKNGNIYFTKNHSENNSDKKDLAKLDSEGTILWEKQAIYEQANSIYVYHYKISNISDSVFIAGTLSDGIVQKFFLSKIAADESDSWVKLWKTEDKEHRFGTITSIALDSEGNAFVTGHTSGIFENNDAGNPSSETASDGFLTKFDNSGNLLWTKQSGKSFSDFYSEVAVDEFDNIYLTGSENIIDPVSMNAGTNMFISKLTSDGKQIWKKTSRHENEIISGGHLAFIENDIVFLGSRCEFTTLVDEPYCFPQPFLRRYNPDGKIIWEKRWQGQNSKPSETEAIDITVIKEKVYSLLQTKYSWGSPDIILTVFSKNGDFILSQIFKSDCQDYPSEILPLPDNKIMLIGSSDGWIGTDLSTAECESESFKPFALILEPLDQ